MSKQPFGPLSREEVEAFKRDGVICLRGFFDQQWCERMKAASLRHAEDTALHMARRGAGLINPPPGLEHMFMAETDEDFKSFLFDSPLSGIARALLQADEVRYFYDQLFIKKAKVKKSDAVAQNALDLMQMPTPWHQDVAYWPFVGNDILSIWVPFTDAPKAAAGLEYVRGSHLWGTVYAPIGMASNCYDEPIPTSLMNGSGDYELLSWDLAPGDCIAHHPKVVHRSFPNTSENARIAVSTRFFGPDAIYKPDTVNEGWYPDDAGIGPGRLTSSVHFPVVP